MDLNHLILKLEAASKEKFEGDINIKQCQIETEILGHLIGKKVRMGNSKYIPDDLDLEKYPHLPLKSLNLLATKTSVAFIKEYKKRPVKPQTVLTSEPQRA